MKKLLVLLAIAFVLLASCEPTADGGDAPANVYKNVSITTRTGSNGTKFVEYEVERSRTANNYDLFTFYVSKSTADEYSVGFIFNSTESFNKESIESLIYKNSTENNSTPLGGSELGYGLADEENGLYKVAALVTVTETIVKDLAESQIQVELKGTKNGDILCKIPSYFEQAINELTL